MKKYLFFYLIAFPFLPAAQTRHKAEKELMLSLNEVLNKSDQIHWAYNGKMSIDTSFYISQSGMLSVTVIYKTDSDTYKVRMAAPVNKIQNVIQDEYIILVYPQNDVSVFETDRTGQWIKVSERNLFHIGRVSDKGLLFKKVQQAFTNFKKENGTNLIN
ncbi:MAG TPA: hypothetical protein VIJ27_14005 [Mucilaginibacter sp.]